MIKKITRKESPFHMKSTLLQNSQLPQGLSLVHSIQQQQYSIIYHKNFIHQQKILFSFFFHHFTPIRVQSLSKINNLHTLYREFIEVFRLSTIHFYYIPLKLRDCFTVYRKKKVIRFWWKQKFFRKMMRDFPN